MFSVFYNWGLHRIISEQDSSFLQSKIFLFKSGIILPWVGACAYEK